MDAQRIHEIFARILSRAEGIRDILLVSDDGFPLASTLPTGDREALLTASGALINEAGERGAKELELGEIDLHITLCSGGYCVMKRLVPGVLILVITDTGKEPPPLGKVLFLIKRSVPEFLAAMR